MHITHVPLSHSWSFLKSVLAATVVIALKSSCARRNGKAVTTPDHLVRTLFIHHQWLFLRPLKRCRDRYA